VVEFDIGSTKNFNLEETDESLKTDCRYYWCNFYNSGDLVIVQLLDFRGEMLPANYRNHLWYPYLLSGNTIMHPSAETRLDRLCWLLGCLSELLHL